MNRFIVGLICMQLITMGASCNPPQNIRMPVMQPVSQPKRAENVPPIPNIFIDPEAFQKTANIPSAPMDGAPIAGIVNHHALAMDLQSRFFKTLRRMRPEITTFIVLSPDHFNAGPGISYHQRPYATPSGVLQVNTELAGRLSGIGAWMPAAREAFANEHGIGALAPFIKREFHNATIVPVYLGLDLSAGEARRLAAFLADRLDEKTFLVISSDMSHYLPAKEAGVRDQRTMAWLEENDWSALEGTSDEYTDARAAFATMKYLFENGEKTPRFRMLDHRISSDYGADEKKTTSYITGFYLMSEQP